MRYFEKVCYSFGIEWEEEHKKPRFGQNFKLEVETNQQKDKYAMKKSEITKWKQHSECQKNWVSQMLSWKFYDDVSSKAEALVKNI